MEFLAEAIRLPRDLTSKRIFRLSPGGYTARTFGSALAGVGSNLWNFTKPNRGLTFIPFLLLGADNANGDASFGTLIMSVTTNDRLRIGGICISIGLVALGLLAGSDATPAEADAAESTASTIGPLPIRANMRFLADDLLEGRGTATRGHELAAKFMATRFEAMGLTPAGDSGTYLQRVPLRSMKVDDGKVSFSWVREGKEELLTANKDYVLRADPSRRESSVEASVAFVGFGVTAPEQRYDDYKKIDVHGKIVALIFGAPSFEPSVRAYYTSLKTKAMNAIAHGAVGLIVLDDPALEGSEPFESQIRESRSPRFQWLDKEGNPSNAKSGLKGFASLSLPATYKLFEGSGHSADQIFKNAKGGSPGSFNLPVIVTLKTATVWHDTESYNVVAKLEGSDPTLKNEYLVYTAHLDHLGIGEAVGGDSIYNGALDNASGSAILLEVARAFSEMRPKPLRSIIFMSETGEEVGLLGSDYFAHYPTVSRNALVADLDVDTDFMLWPLQDILAFGIEHSTLAVPVRQAAERMHLVQSPDPMPEQVLFIRGDNYSFVEQGIPSVALSPGVKSNNPEIDPLVIAGKWLQTRYHQPGDDMGQPGLNFDEAAKFARFVYFAGYSIANRAQRPEWNQGDFFGERFKLKKDLTR